MLRNHSGIDHVIRGSYTLRDSVHLPSYSVTYLKHLTAAARCLLVLKYPYFVHYFQKSLQGLAIVRLVPCRCGDAAEVSGGSLSRAPAIRADRIGIAAALELNSRGIAGITLTYRWQEIPPARPQEVA